MIKLRISFGTMLGVLLLISSINVFGQQAQSTQEPNIFYRGTVVQGPPGPPDQADPVGAPLPVAGKTFAFVSSEMEFEGKIVKKAPYSAEAVTETTQTLSDGNRVVNKSSSLVYRDSEGRTRREHTLRGFGPFANTGEPLRTIFINDPVAAVTYMLDTRTHVAHKSQPLRLEKQVFQREVSPGPGSGPDEDIFTLRAPAPGPVPGPAPGMAAQFVFKREGPENVSSESLGKQIIEGVEAEGTRSTRIIPAGEIGNERPIQIVSERWYSPQLQTVVLSRHNDPLIGETVYKLTNISREEPARSLFEVPADYTVKEGTAGERVWIKKAPPAQ